MLLECLLCAADILSSCQFREELLSQSIATVVDFVLIDSAVLLAIAPVRQACVKYVLFFFQFISQFKDLELNLSLPFMFEDTLVRLSRPMTKAIIFVLVVWCAAVAMADMR